MGKQFNTDYSVKLLSIGLVGGRVFKNCYIDYMANCPPGFIALRKAEQPDGTPVVLKYVKVANINYFNVEETEAGKLWDCFNPLPETVKTK